MSCLHSGKTSAMLCELDRVLDVVHLVCATQTVDAKVFNGEVLCRCQGVDGKVFNGEVLCLSG